MTRPSLKPKQVISALERAGFLFRRQRGSHARLFHPGTNRQVTIPVHNRDMKVGTLRSILKQARLSDEEFRRLL